MRYLLAFLLTLLAGCSAPPATFSAQPGLEAATRAAVAGWEQALPCDIHVEYVSHDAEVLVEWRDVADAGGHTRLGYGGIHGDEFLEWGDFNAWVYVDPVTEPEKLDMVVAHEMGHALRVDHSANRTDLMYEVSYTGKSPLPTARDGRAVCEAWGYR